MKISIETWVKALESERDKLIKDHPELEAYQKEIELALKDIEDPLERAAEMNRLLMKKMREELLPAMAKLRQIQNKKKAA